MRIILAICFIISIQAFANDYPKLYAQLGDALYDADKPIEALSKNDKTLSKANDDYQKLLHETKAFGFKVGSSNDFANKKIYLKKLRMLQKKYDYFLHLLHGKIKHAIESKNYNQFLQLTAFELQDLLKPSGLHEEAFAFYQENSSKEKIAFFEKQLKYTNYNNTSPTSIKLLPTQVIKHIGNPYKNYYPNGEDIFSRNIWDMHTYDGKIFLGAGNSANHGPSPNSGRVPIISYDTKKGLFKKEGIVAEEQINIYRTINNELFIPGHDATQNWSFGNFYKRLHDGTWKKHRTIPKALHLYDIAYFNKRLFVGLGLNRQGAVGVSSDMGRTWNIIKIGKSPSRVYSFLELENTLFAIKSFSAASKRKKWSKVQRKNYFSVAEYQSGTNFGARFDLTPQIMFPNTKLHLKKSKKIIRTKKISTSAIYIGAYTVNDHHSLPFGAYIASSLHVKHTNIFKIPLPKNYIPWDTLVKGEHVYLLCYDRKNIVVMHTTTANLSQWNPLFSFASPTFARSFEMLDGNFYFGLGSDIKSSKQWSQSELHPQTGDIIMLNAKDINTAKRNTKNDRNNCN